MSFLEKNIGNEEKEEEQINFMEEFVSLLLYITFTISYFIKKNITKKVFFFFISLTTIYLIYSRFYKEKTEMIDGMEVPRLKDNYDLNLD